MTTLLLTVLVASLLGSLHCAGMCGGFVAFYAGAGQMQGDRSSRPWLAHLVYSAGRLLVYATLGALGGALGAALDLAGSAVHLQRVAGLLAGAVMLIWGAVALLPALGVRMPLPGAPRVLTALIGRAVSRLRGRPPIVRAAAMGALTTLLPCGWLYAFVVAAAGTGSALAGVAVMSAFWLGTVPVLLGLGVGVQQLSRLLGRHLPAITATAVMLLGVLALVSRLTGPVPGAGAGHTPAAHRAPQDQVEALVSGDETPECHHHDP